MALVVGTAHPQRQSGAVPRVWAATLAAAAIAALGLAGQDTGLPLAIAAVTWLVTWRSLSPLVRAYIGLIVLGFAVAPSLSTLGTPGLEATRPLAASWIVASCLGGCLSSSMARSTPRLRPSTASVAPALLLSSASLLVTVHLLSNGSRGIAAQYAGEAGGGGYLGILVPVGPPAAAAAFLSLLRRGVGPLPWLGLAGISVACQALVLAFSGFRGAGPAYLLAVTLCWAHDPQRQRGSSLPVRLGAMALVIVSAVVLFLLGASARDQAAKSAGQSGMDLGDSNAQSLLHVVADRLDYVPYLSAALTFRDDEDARHAVSIGRQLAAAMPRVLFPDKQTVDYGHAVAVAIFQLPPTTKTSSTVTSLGDAVINLGVGGGLFLVAAYVFIVDAVAARLHRAPGVAALAVRLIVVAATLDLEAPVVLSLIGMLRATIAVVVALFVAKILLRGFREFGTRAIIGPVDSGV